MTLNEAVELALGDKTQDRQRFFSLGKTVAAGLAADFPVVTIGQALYFAQTFGFDVLPRQAFGSRDGGQVAYGALREGVISGIYSKLAKLANDIAPVAP